MLIKFIKLISLYFPSVLFHRMYKFFLGLLFITNATAGGWYAVSCPNGLCRLDGWTSLLSTSKFPTAC